MIISLAYEYFDNKKELYGKYIDDNNIKAIRRSEHSNDMEQLNFEILSDDGNVVATGNYSIIGYFNNEISTWYWGWAVPFPVKSENYLSRKLLNYAMDLDINTNDIVLSSILKAELLNSKIYIGYPTLEIEKYIALSLYVTKSDYYKQIMVTSYNVKTKKTETIGSVYYFLRNIEIKNKND